LPPGAAAGTVMVIVEVPLPGAGMVLGLKPTVTPVGWPEADSEIAALKPLPTVLVIVEVPLEPCSTETVEGEAERVKVVGAVTVKVTLVYCM